MSLLPLSLVWFFVLGGLGIWFPFHSLYFSENAGLSGAQLGVVLATVPAAGLLAQPFWGLVADRTGSRKRVLALVAFGTALGYGNLFGARGFPELALATGLLAFFSTALIPNCVAVTLALTRHLGAHVFGRVRVWGTVGFGVFMLSFPSLLDRLQQRQGLVPGPQGPSEPGLEWMFPSAGAVVLVGALLVLWLRPTAALQVRAQPGDARRLLGHAPFLRLLAFSVGAYLCLQSPMALLPLFVTAHGGSLETVSHMWLLMLAVEIPLIWFSGASVERLGARALLAIGVLAGGLRWLSCVLLEDLLWIGLVQGLHGVTVAGLVIGGPLYVDAVVPERLRSTGQGLLAMLGVSLGGVLSHLSGGWLLEHSGVDAPYLLGGAGALALGCLVPWILPGPERPAEP